MNQKKCFSGYLYLSFMMMIGQLLLHALMDADQFCLFWPPELLYIQSYIYIHIPISIHTNIIHTHTHTSLAVTLESPNKHITSTQQENNHDDHDREFGIQSPESQTLRLSQATCVRCCKRQYLHFLSHQFHLLHAPLAMAMLVILPG